MELPGISTHRHVVLPWFRCLVATQSISLSTQCDALHAPGAPFPSDERTGRTPPLPRICTVVVDHAPLATVVISDIWHGPSRALFEAHRAHSQHGPMTDMSSGLTRRAASDWSGTRHQLPLRHLNQSWRRAVTHRTTKSVMGTCKPRGLFHYRHAPVQTLDQKVILSSCEHQHAADQTLAAVSRYGSSLSAPGASGSSSRCSVTLWPVESVR